MCLDTFQTTSERKFQSSRKSDHRNTANTMYQGRSLVIQNTPLCWEIEQSLITMKMQGYEIDDHSVPYVINVLRNNTVTIKFLFR